MIISESNLHLEDLGRSVILFGASWCMPCRALKPILENLATEFPDYEFFYVDVDSADADFVAEQRIQSVPTVKVVVDGEVKATLNGLQTRSKYEAVLQENL